MSAPDEMVEAVAQAEWEHDGPFLRWEQLTEPLKETSRERARAALSVPSVAEAIARDAKAREIVNAHWAGDYDEQAGAFDEMAALYPEAGK